MNGFGYEERLQHIIRFYTILDELEQKAGGKRLLANCHGRMNWPKRGVYFFFEEGEVRSTSGEGLRVVRVGTHALKKGAKATFWNRLRQHKGIEKSGAGNHRGSVFRKHVGTALIKRDDWTGPPAVKWGQGSKAPKSVRQAEKPIERAVSTYIRAMPFLWVKVKDDPGPDSDRGVIERNAIALLSNYNANPDSIDTPSPGWLGRYSKSEEIQLSGMWNVNHVSESYDPEILDLLHWYVGKMDVSRP
jgi:hypothetical protein